MGDRHKDKSVLGRGGGQRVKAELRSTEEEEVLSHWGQMCGNPNVAASNS